MTQNHAVVNSSTIIVPQTVCTNVHTPIVRTLYNALAFADDMYRQQAIPSVNRWLRFIKGVKTQPTASHFNLHLSGKRGATYAATFSKDGMSQLLTADDDAGGIDAAQSAVDHLHTVGIFSFAIARQSLDHEYQPRHNGSHLFVPLDKPISTDVAKRTLIHLLSNTNYSTSEVMQRSMMPFGVHRRAARGSEYGLLVLPNTAPMQLTSAAHGMELIAQYAPTSVKQFVIHTPPELVKIAIAKIEVVKQHAINTGNQITHKEVVELFNERYTVRDVLAWLGFQPVSTRNYRCTCANHAHGDKSASIGITLNNKLAFFNVSGCRYYNYRKPFTAFSLWQVVGHDNDYHATINDARNELGLPDFERGKTKSSIFFNSNNEFVDQVKCLSQINSIKEKKVEQATNICSVSSDAREKCSIFFNSVESMQTLDRSVILSAVIEFLQTKTDYYKTKTRIVRAIQGYLGDDIDAALIKSLIPKARYEINALTQHKREMQALNNDELHKTVNTLRKTNTKRIKVQSAKYHKIRHAIASDELQRRQPRSTKPQNGTRATKPQNVTEYMLDTAIMDAYDAGKLRTYCADHSMNFDQTFDQVLGQVLGCSYKM